MSCAGASENFDSNDNDSNCFSDIVMYNTKSDRRRMSILLG